MPRAVNQSINPSGKLHAAHHDQRPHKRRGIGACVTPKADRHEVALTSAPVGALVSCGGEQCVAPCVPDVRANFSFHSRYDFPFSLDGYRSQTDSFEEPTVFHGQGVLPSKVYVDMHK